MYKFGLFLFLLFLYLAKKIEKRGNMARNLIHLLQSLRFWVVLSLFFVVSSWAEILPSVQYMKADGSEGSAKNVTILDGSETEPLREGWYVVQGEVSFSGPVVFDGSVNLILADNAVLNINAEKSIFAFQVDNGDLNIFGQSDQSGSMNISAGLFGVDVSGNVSINGVNVVSLNSCAGFINATGDLNINGGNVAGEGGLFGTKGITLNWTKSSDLIKVSNYGYLVSIADGKVFKDESGNLYSGTLSQELRKAIEGTALTPFTGVTVAFVDRDTTIATVAPDESGHVTAPKKRIRKGYKFFGWFTSADGDIEFDFATDISQNTTVYAKWIQNESITYIDENGKDKNFTNYIELTSDMAVSNLPAATYVVKGNVTFTSPVVFSGDANLVLADGAELNVNVEDNYIAIESTGILKIFGQKNNTGLMNVSGKSNVIYSYGIYGRKEIYIYGGNVTVVTQSVDKPTAIMSDNNITIKGAKVSVSSAYYGIHSDKDITINSGIVSVDNKHGAAFMSNRFYFYGGEVSVVGSGGSISARKGITLGWTYNYPGIIVDSINVGSYYGVVTIANGKKFKDEYGNIYSGTLSDELNRNIRRKTLSPFDGKSVAFVDKMGDDAITVAEYAIDETGVVPVPKNPIRFGYKFLGWFTEVDGGTKFDFNAADFKNLTVYAKWEPNDPVKYIDENGVEHSVTNYTELTENMYVQYLSDGWYVVRGNVNYTEQIVFGGKTNLILTDGAELNVNVSSSVAIYGSQQLTIYGQQEQSGVLSATGTLGGISGSVITVNSGKVNVVSTFSNGVYCENFNINGGDVSFASPYLGVYGSVFINGGRVAFSDNIGNIANVVVIGDGKAFQDESGNLYLGELSLTQRTALVGKSLEPCLKIGDYAAVQIFEDKNGNKRAIINADYTGNETLSITTPIDVDSVEFKRALSPLTPATTVLPFKLPDGTTLNAMFYYLKEVVQEGCSWNATMKYIGEGNLPQANTPYALILNEGESKLKFDMHGKQATVQTDVIADSVDETGKWYFKGLYSYRVWRDSDEGEDNEIGLAYGFAGSNEDGVAKGEFGRIVDGAYAVPMRSYLRKANASVRLNCSASAPAKVKGLAPYKANYASAETGVINVRFVENDENGVEKTTAVGRMNAATGEIKIDRWYDLKGRRVNNVNRAAKGAYYGNKVRRETLKK
jgi:uncharacterized repeat protein (TIGR02543 family)